MPRYIHKQPISEASVWYGRDLQHDTSWIRHFSAAELDELDSVLKHLETGGGDPLSDGAAVFPLPRLGPVLQDLLHELEQGRGFIMLRGLPSERYQPEQLRKLYAGIGAHLGKLITQNRQGERIGMVTWRGSDYSKPTARGYQSRNTIRPHCDSSDYVGLLCVQPACQGGASTIVSATAIYNAILQQHPQYLELLCRGFRYNLSGKGVTGSMEELTYNTIPVFSYYGGRLSCRFNQKQIEDGAMLLGKPLTTLEQQAIECVAQLATNDHFRLDMDFRQGDIQLLNNHCILHARTEYEDYPEPERRRLLLRLWINNPAGRELAPEFADRLNTGPRGEVSVA
jgi:hypothetical protein